jgi:RNA polymerase sigma-70 factor (ECF subfamily)
MSEHDWLADRFEADRAHLRAVAYRMLGSATEADDAVQESWLRLSRSDVSEVENLTGWLTTVVARVSLNMLQSRRSRREDPLEERLPAAVPAEGPDPEHEAMLADSVGAALLVVLETLAPAERLAFVLHDLFAVPFEEIAPIVGRSPVATRQLASRARRRVQGAEATPEADRNRQRRIVDAFLAASREGDFEALLTMLDPDVVLSSDDIAAQSGSPAQLRGARDVAGTFSGRAREARPAWIDGSAGLAWAPGGQPRVVFDFTFGDGRIVAIDILADLAGLDVALVD